MVPISISMCLCLKESLQNITQAIYINRLISDFEKVISHLEEYDFTSDEFGS